MGIGPIPVLVASVTYYLHVQQGMYGTDFLNSSALLYFFRNMKEVGEESLAAANDPGRAASRSR